MAHLPDSMKGAAMKKTPMGEVRGLGSARSGTEHFWRQRVTALALVPLTLAFIAVLIAMAHSPVEKSLLLLRSPLVALLFLLFIATGMIHTRLGMNVIIEDYLHSHKLRIAALVLNTFFCALVGAASAFAVLKLSLWS